MIKCTSEAEVVAESGSSNLEPGLRWSRRTGEPLALPHSDQATRRPSERVRKWSPNGCGSGCGHNRPPPSTGCGRGRTGRRLCAQQAARPQATEKRPASTKQARLFGQACQLTRYHLVSSDDSSRTTSRATQREPRRSLFMLRADGRQGRAFAVRSLLLPICRSAQLALFRT